MCEPGASAARPSALGRPRWSALYGLVLPQLAALAALELSGSPNALRLAVRYALALGTFAAMAAWVRSNRVAIDLRDWCECAAQTMTIRVIESRPLDPMPPRTEPSWAEEPAEPALR